MASFDEFCSWKKIFLTGKREGCVNLVFLWPKSLFPSLIFVVTLRPKHRLRKRL